MFAQVLARWTAVTFVLLGFFAPAYCADHVLGYKLISASNLRGKYDVVLIIANDLSDIRGIDSDIHGEIEEYSKVDSSGGAIVVPSKMTPGGKLVYSPVEKAYDDYDDVRGFSEAGKIGLKRSLSIGAKSILLVVLNRGEYVHAKLVTVLGVLQDLYVPKEAKDMQGMQEKISVLAVYEKPGEQSHVTKRAEALELGRLLTRDIIGGDPERMTPPAVANFISDAFDGSNVKVDIVDDQDELEKEYPSVAIVNRGCNHIDKYKARVVKLEYTGKGSTNTTLLMLGKGVTFDTGGHDIKISGGMRTMRLDKGGAASVAGFFKILSELRPAGIKAYGRLPLVRNCVGSRAYLASELLKARSGKILGIVNTDAEGRLIMVDPLSELREIANNESLKLPNPYIISMATLTYHAHLAYGPYSAVIGNKLSESMALPAALAAAGDQIGDPLDVSRLRQEDFTANRDPSPYADLLHSPPQSSSKTPRGHQIPFAYLIEGSGLLENGIKPAKGSVSIPYTHLDMGSTEIDPVPNARPLLSLVAGLIFPALP